VYLLNALWPLDSADVHRCLCLMHCRPTKPSNCSKQSDVDWSVIDIKQSNISSCHRQTCLQAIATCLWVCLICAITLCLYFNYCGHFRSNLWQSRPLDIIKPICAVFCRWWPAVFCQTCFVICGMHYWNATFVMCTVQWHVLLGRLFWVDLIKWVSNVRPYVLRT